MLVDLYLINIIGKVGRGPNAQKWQEAGASKAEQCLPTCHADLTTCSYH